jgi:hypothetical protein
VVDRRTERRLRKVAKRLTSAREELRVLDEQQQYLTDDADSSAVQAMVSDDGNLAREHRSAVRHAQTAERRRVALRDEVASLETQQDELLDEMNSLRSE